MPEKIPSKNQDKLPEEEKRIEELRGELKNCRDKLGEPIDHGIFDTVVILNALGEKYGFITTASCEGHIDRGLLGPWVDITAPNEPEERFIDEKKIFEEVAKKYNIPVEDIYNNEEAWREAINECLKKGETEEFKKWKLELEKVFTKIERLLQEFYENRNVEPNIKIQIQKFVDGIRITTCLPNEKEEKKARIELSDEEKQIIEEILKKRQEEMKEFTKFLENIY